jgi:hypothetical protein
MVIINHKKQLNIILRREKKEKLLLESYRCCIMENTPLERAYRDTCNVIVKEATKIRKTNHKSHKTFYIYISSIKLN